MRNFSFDELFNDAAVEFEIADPVVDAVLNSLFVDRSNSEKKRAERRKATIRKAESKRNLDMALNGRAEFDNRHQYSKDRFYSFPRESRVLSQEKKEKISKDDIRKDFFQQLHDYHDEGKLGSFMSEPEKSRISVDVTARTRISFDLTPAEAEEYAVTHEIPGSVRKRAILEFMNASEYGIFDSVDIDIAE